MERKNARNELSSGAAAEVDRKMDLAVLYGHLDLEVFQSTPSNDFICLLTFIAWRIQDKMDPYVILSYGGRKQNSKIASGQGSELEWNQTFTFDVNYSGGADLTLKIMDSDYGTEDDGVGEAT
uniref:C2 domain-containing protein n=1 Tax=Chenopodium quinoa TaxID=63459 RepID=A0A803MYK3_CHEQI